MRIRNPGGSGDEEIVPWSIWGWHGMQNFSHFVLYGTWERGLFAPFPTRAKDFLPVLPKILLFNQNLDVKLKLHSKTLSLVLFGWNSAAGLSELFLVIKPLDPDPDSLEMLDPQFCCCGSVTFWYGSGSGAVVSIFTHYFLKVHLLPFYKSQNNKKKVFLLLVVVGRIRFCTKYWRIRIREAQKHTDPDLQQWFFMLKRYGK